MDNHPHQPTQRPIGMDGRQAPDPTVNLSIHLALEGVATRRKRPSLHGTDHTKGTLLAHPEPPRGMVDGTRQYLLYMGIDCGVEQVIEYLQQITAPVVAVFERRAMSLSSQCSHGNNNVLSCSIYITKITTRTTTLQEKWREKLAKPGPRSVLTQQVAVAQ